MGLSAVSVPFTRRARWLVGALVLLALVFSGHLLTWWIVTARIADGIPAFLAAAARDGWRIQAAPAHRAGWPWAAKVRAPDIVATRTIAGAEFRWTAPHVDLSIRPDAPGTLRIEPGGTQTLSWRDASVQVWAGSAALLLAPEGGGPATLAIQDLHASTAGTDSLTIGRIAARFDALSISATADDILPTHRAASPFDGPAALSFLARATQPWPAPDAPGGPAMAWRDAGGRLHLPDIILRWGPLQASGHADGELDAALQPAFRAELRIQGGPAALDAASRAGVIQPAAASAANAVLGLLALATQGGAQGGPVTVPIVLADRTLTIAQFPLLRLAPIEGNLP